MTDQQDSSDLLGRRDEEYHEQQVRFPDTNITLTQIGT